MTEKREMIRSIEEDLEILYNLKSLVQKYRSGNLSVKSKDILKGYADAVIIAAEENNKSEASVFDELMRPIKETLSENVDEAAVAKAITHS